MPSPTMIGNGMLVVALLTLPGCSETQEQQYNDRNPATQYYDWNAATVVGKMLSADRDSVNEGYATAIHATAPSGNPARVDSIVAGLLAELGSAERPARIVTFIAITTEHNRPDLGQDLLRAVRAASPRAQYAYARIAHKLPVTPELLGWLTAAATARQDL